MANSDAELIQRTLDGDDTAFGFLVDKYKGAVHALAYRKIGNFHTAEDITQDTFLQAYQKLHTLKDWRHFPGWLYRIASRLCLMWHRGQRLVPQPLDKVESSHMDALAWAKHTDRQTRQSVHDGLEALPESQRTVLTLHYLGGMTCEEIARFIGTSRGAVLNRLYHARHQLKKEMIPMMESTLGAFQLPPTFTQQMMNRIDRTPPTTTPQGKPFLPWIAAAATLVVGLLIGFGQRSMTRFQQPYSLAAVEPASRVELIDAPMVALPETKPNLANRRGQLKSREYKKGIGPNGTFFSAAANADVGTERNDTEWTQTNGPYGGRTNTLFRASDGTLYASTDMSVYRSYNDGDSWVQVYNGLTANHANSWLSGTITDANGVLYINSGATILYSKNRGESWQQMNYLYGADTAIRTFSVIRSRIYISRVKDGVAYSDDYGESWTPIQGGLPTQPPDKFATVGTTLFAKVGNVIFRLREGETSWAKITNLPDLRFLIAEESTLIIGSQTELHRSVDEGETWTSIANIMRGRTSWSAETVRKTDNLQDVFVLATAGKKQLQLGNLGLIRFSNAGEVSMPETPGLKIQSLTILYVSAVGDTIYLLLNDGRLLRTTEYGFWSITEASRLSSNSISIDSMAALSESMVCIGHSAGIFRWTVGEKSWKRINEGIIGSMVRSLVSFKNELYASTYNLNDVYRSVDGGNRWTPIHGGLPTTDVGALAVSGDALYLGVNEENFTGTDDPTTSGIYRLADDQNSWIPVQTEMRTAYIDNDRRRGYHQMYSVEELVISGDTFYVIAQMGSGSRLYRWRSGERYWTDISPHPEDWIYMGDDELTSPAVAKETVYIVADMDLYRSRNSGDSWSKIDVPGSPSSRYSPQVNGVVVVGQAVFITTLELGVLRSVDHGETWEFVNDGLPGVNQRELHTIGNTLYTARWDEGIYRLMDGGDSWEFVKLFLSDYPDVVGELTIADGTLYAAIGESGVYRIALDNADGD